MEVVLVPLFELCHSRAHSTGRPRCQRRMPPAT